ncbi:hypothetical protein Tco_0303194 [Tanacetum coccineum]
MGLGASAATGFVTGAALVARGLDWLVALGLVALAVMDDQLGEPNTWDHKRIGFLLSLNLDWDEILPTISLIFSMGSDCRPRPKESVTLELLVTQFFDKVDESIKCWWGRKWIVVVDLCDLKGVSECVFGPHLLRGMIDHQYEVGGAIEVLVQAKEHYISTQPFIVSAQSHPQKGIHTEQRC